MPTTSYTIAITDGFVVEPGPMADNTAYLTFVINTAAQSYAAQYRTDTVEDGITAAREAYNAALPPAQAAPAEDAAHG